jgi:hypothetical protein
MTVGSIYHLSIAEFRIAISQYAINLLEREFNIEKSEKERVR